LGFHQTTTTNQKRTNYPLEGETLDYYESIKNDQRRSASVLSKLGGLATHLKEHDVSIWCMVNANQMGNCVATDLISPCSSISLPNSHFLLAATCY
jgi:hypothetical protein